MIFFLLHFRLHSRVALMMKMLWELSISCMMQLWFLAATLWVNLSLYSYRAYGTALGAINHWTRVPMVHVLECDPVKSHIKMKKDAKLTKPDYNLMVKNIVLLVRAVFFPYKGILVDHQQFFCIYSPILELARCNLWATWMCFSLSFFGWVYDWRQNLLFCSLIIQHSLVGRYMRWWV